MFRWEVGGFTVAGLTALAWFLLRVKPLGCWFGRHHRAMRLVDRAIEWYCPRCFTYLGTSTSGTTRDPRKSPFENLRRPP